MKIILTGATGMVGEGVLFECLENPKITEVLVVGRNHYDLAHSKLKELLVPDFLKADDFANQLSGYDGCFYCAGVSSVGMGEEKYTRITYDTTIQFAKTVLEQSPDCVFVYVTGRGTDSSEQGKLMWARVKGKTENKLMGLGFRGQYNFRPAIMLPTKGQKSIKPILLFLTTILKYVMPKATLTLKEVGNAMINMVVSGYPKQILEVKDIKMASK